MDFEVLGACELIMGNWVSLNSRVEFWVCNELRMELFDFRFEA